MTTITLARPTARHPRYQVFGRYEAPDGSDRYTFGLREFGATDGEAAERCARAMVERFRADHFERTAR